MIERRFRMNPVRFLRDLRGNAGAEFALVLPILMLLLFGAIEIGRALHDYQVINEAVRDAGRYLSRVPATCPSAGVGAGSIVDPADEVRARALAMTGDVDTAPPEPNLLGYWDYGTQSSSVTISVDCIANPDPGGGRNFQGFYSETEFIPHIVLTAEVPFEFLFGGLIGPGGTIDIELSHNVISVGL